MVLAPCGLVIFRIIYYRLLGSCTWWRPAKSCTATWREPSSAHPDRSKLQVVSMDQCVKTLEKHVLGGLFLVRAWIKGRSPGVFEKLSKLWIFPTWPYFFFLRLFGFSTRKWRHHFFFFSCNFFFNFSLSPLIKIEFEIEEPIYQEFRMSALDTISNCTFFCHWFAGPQGIKDIRVMVLTSDPLVGLYVVFKKWRII